MAKKLTQEQIQDAARLKRAYEVRKSEDKSLTQEKLAAACDWKTQSAVTQYMNAEIALNLDALIKFSLALDVPIAEISPTLAQKIIAVRLRMDDTVPAVSPQAIEVARNFDRLQKPAQKAAVMLQLEAFLTS